MQIHIQIEYHTRWGEELLISISENGEEREDIVMLNNGKGVWYIDIEIKNSPKTSYCYKVIEKGRIIRHEEGQPHKIPSINTATMVIFDVWREDKELTIQQRPVIIPHVKLNYKPLWQGVGTAIPIFSLRSKNSFGIGEFSDLKQLAYWATITGQSVIQTLPINDTIMTRTWRDSYPYNANSSFALNPIYINLEEIGKFKDKKIATEFYKERKELNSLKKIDFEKVLKAKWKYSTLLYKEYGDKCLNSNSFNVFFKKNSKWLKPYAVYCYFRDKYHTPNFREWHESNYNSELTETLCNPTSPQYKKVALHLFIQYHLDKQLKSAKKYANNKGIILKGDIPIGISRNSVDAWVYPHLFNTDCMAGAPPDDFAADGQNWGFPTYNWEVMKTDNYAWFVERFKRMADYFDAYRIDHLLGYLRIWEIDKESESGLLGQFNPALPLSSKEIESYGFPFNAAYHAHALSSDNKTDLLFLEDREKKGLYHPRILGYETKMFKLLSNNEQEKYISLYNNFFYHLHDQFWLNSAISKLPTIIGATNMLACGEDLGMIPDCTKKLIKELRLLSLEIYRMPKNKESETSHPAAWPYMSVCSTSSHDMSGIREWIEKEHPVIAGQKYSKASTEICSKVIAEHLCSPSMLTIIPLQDWLSIDSELRHPHPDQEQINVPSNPDNYWQYRLHIPLETIINSEKFNANILSLIKSCGR